MGINNQIIAGAMHGEIDILYLNTGSKNVLNRISYLVISHLDDITYCSKQYILYGCFAFVAGYSFCLFLVTCLGDRPQFLSGWQCLFVQTFLLYTLIFTNDEILTIDLFEYK